MSYLLNVVIILTTQTPHEINYSKVRQPEYSTKY